MKLSSQKRFFVFVLRVGWGMRTTWGCQGPSYSSIQYINKHLGEEGLAKKQRATCKGSVVFEDTQSSGRLRPMAWRIMAPIHQPPITMPSCVPPKDCCRCSNKHPPKWLTPTRWSLWQHTRKNTHTEKRDWVPMCAVSYQNADEVFISTPCIYIL